MGSVSAESPISSSMFLIKIDRSATHRSKAHHSVSKISGGHGRKEGAVRIPTGISTVSELIKRISWLGPDMIDVGYAGGATRYRRWVCYVEEHEGRGSSGCEWKV